MGNPADFRIKDEELEELIFKYCRDFTKGAQEGKFDPITGRDDEINQAILILLQKGRKNVALQAPAGVGKTALCVGLAQQIAAGNVPDYLKDARVLEVDLASMAAGTVTKAEFEGRFMPFINGVAERYNTEGYPVLILFFDEMHTLMYSNTASSYAGLSEIMKPYLTAGNLLVIGATTKDEYKQFVAVDPAMDRRFQKVELSIPTADQAFIILQALRGGFEKHHKIRVGDEVLQRIVALTEEHMKNRNQPDKSIMMLDAACAVHVFQHGWDTDLLKESLYDAMAKQTGIHAKAFAE